MYVLYIHLPIHRREEDGRFDTQDNDDAHSHGLDSSTRLMHLPPVLFKWCDSVPFVKSSIVGQRQQLNYHAPSVDRSFYLPVYRQTPQQPSAAVTTAPGAFPFDSKLASDVFDARSPKTDSSSAESSNRINCTTADSANVRIIKLHNRNELLGYYADAFHAHALQQSNCRVIAKAFVKAVEPKKQARYPYNGGKKTIGADGTRTRNKGDSSRPSRSGGLLV